MNEMVANDVDVVDGNDENNTCLNGDDGDVVISVLVVDDDNDYGDDDGDD